MRTNLWKLALGMPFLLLVSNALRAADTIPAEISDKVFWEMVSTMSEKGGSFPYENFLSNEVSIQRVIPPLKTIVKPGGVYIGVGPEQNFTYAAALQSKLAFVVDIRRQNMVEHLMYKALFDLSTDRADFVSRLFSRKRPAGLNDRSAAEALFQAYSTGAGDADLYRQNLAAIQQKLVKDHGFPLDESDLQSIAYVYDVFYKGGPPMNYEYASTRLGCPTCPSYVSMMTTTDNDGHNWSYLATEENYRYVREMQRKNLIVPLVGDFAGPAAIRNIGRYLKDHGATVSAFYLSNVEAYLQTGTLWHDFYANVATLPVDSSSTFIRFVDLNNTRYLNPPVGVWVSKISPMADLINAFNANRLPGYHEVLGMLE